MYLWRKKQLPAYILAKDIVHTLLCLQQLIDNDPEVSPYLKVVMVENYNVTYAESIIPAADFSEQISLASKEASGTSNMKFMLNGAVTLGTDDGANVEIHEFVVTIIFISLAQKLIQLLTIMRKVIIILGDILNNDHELRTLVDFIVSDEK